MNTPVIITLPEAERKEIQRKEELLQAELSKGDAERIIDLIADLTGLKTKYVFQSKKNQKMYSDVATLLGRVIEHIKK